MGRVRVDSTGAASIRIKPALRKDAGTIAEMECREWGFPDPRYAFYTWVLDIRYRTVVKAVSGRRIVGFAAASPTADGRFYLDVAVVRKSYRRRGVARALLRSLLARSGDRKVVALTWTANRAAITLLESEGLVRGAHVGHLFGDPKRDYYEWVG
jgi:ribosomal protein S18 acetylase RimI-like enzyme